MFYRTFQAEGKGRRVLGGDGTGVVAPDQQACRIADSESERPPKVLVARSRMGALASTASTRSRSGTISSSPLCSSYPGGRAILWVAKKPSQVPRATLVASPAAAESQVQ